MHVWNQVVDQCLPPKTVDGMRPRVDLARRNTEVAILRGASFQDELGRCLGQVEPKSALVGLGLSDGGVVQFEVEPGALGQELAGAGRTFGRCVAWGPGSQEKLLLRFSGRTLGVLHADDNV